MFGARTPSERDASAAARRRLAALAAQFAAVDDQLPGGRPDPRGASAQSAESESAGEAEPDETPGEHATQGGRHMTRSMVPERRHRSLTAHHVAIISLVVLAIIMVAGWLLLRTIPRSQPVQVSSDRILPSSTPSASVTSSAAGVPPVSIPSSGAPASISSTSTSVVVDVAGKVRRPGIVELPPGSRVVDALDAAGGARPGVDTRSLNLARPLVDGEQIVVGFDVPSIDAPPGAAITSAAPTGTSIAPVDLNTATAEQLDTLPGIGPVTAQAILTWRAENGAFTSVDELLEVSGIGDAILTRYPVGCQAIR